MTYYFDMGFMDKPLVWLHGEVKSPPFSPAGRLEAGYHLRQLQKGVKLALPHSRPMLSIGTRCHELRINDEDNTGRILYRIDIDAIVILEVFKKKSAKTPAHIIKIAKNRIKDYDNA